MARAGQAGRYFGRSTPPRARIRGAPPSRPSRRVSPSGSSPSGAQPPAASGDAPARLAFGPFVLDRQERRLTRADTSNVAGDGPLDVPVQARAFDLVAHLATHAGALVRKDDLFAAVWPGVVVTDAAMTQAVRVARRALADDAAAPTYIETVAGHGYRFIAPVAALPPEPPVAAEIAEPTGSAPQTARPVETAAPQSSAPQSPIAQVPVTQADSAPRPVPRGSVGGAVVGALATSLVGGLLYGVAIGADGPHPTLVSVTAFALGAGVAGAAAVSAGAARAAVWRPWMAPLGGALAGGLAGAIGETVGGSVLATLTGGVPGDLTGGVEGAVVGAALGLAFAPLRRGRHVVLVTALATMLAFAVLAATGHPTFAGSLDAALAVPNDPLRLDVLAPGGLTPGLRVLLGAFEGVLFGLGVGTGARR